MKEKIFDVVALGELLIDFTENGTSAQGNTLFEANPGGAPCNVLAMLRSYGHNVSFIGKVGRDHFGNYLSSVIKEVGIDTSGLVFDSDNPTTLAFVHTKKGGEREFSFYRKNGADAALNTGDLNTDLLKSTKIFHIGTLSLTNDICKAATIKALDIAKNAGSLISFDPNLRENLWDSLTTAKGAIEWGLTQCDILKISDNEIEFVTGTSDIDKGIEIIAGKSSARLICATLGADGAKAYYRENCDSPLITATCKELPNVVTIEKTGAGDTFCGTMLHHVLAQGLSGWTTESLYKMLKVCNIAASLITTKKGALRVMPKVSEIEALL